jgi:ureidoglycolate lyase
MPTPTVRELKVEPATPEALAPFGQVLGVHDQVQPLPTGFYEGKVTVYAPVQFQSDEDTLLTVATVDRRDLRVQWMERHFKHTQTFIPLGGKPFIVVLAPPNDKELPDLDQVRAFLFDGSSGFTMKIGTWHEFPFALLDHSNVIVILRKETTRNLMKERVIAGEAHGPDLDKKDLIARTGIVFAVVP